MIRANVLAGLFCLGFGIWVWYVAGDVPAMTATDNLGGRFFPRLISGAMIVASIGLVVTGLFGVEVSAGTARGPARSTPDEQRRGPAVSFGPGEVRLVLFVVTMAAYVLLLPLLGYLLASVLCFAVMLVLAGESRPLRVAIAAPGITALLYVLFAILFGMNVPEGTLIQAWR